MLHIHGDFYPILREMAHQQNDRIASLLISNDLSYLTVADGDYLNYNSESGQISYRPVSRIDPSLYRSSSLHYAPSGRMTGRPGRIVRRFLTPYALGQLTDRDFEQFTNRLAAYKDDQGTYQLVKGNDIKDAYLYTNYGVNTGSLANSCMAYRECQRYFGIYTNNPAVCNLAVLEKRDKIHARALVWTLLDGRQMLDRIYANDATASQMQRWATEQGFISRDDLRPSERVVQLDKWMFSTYPYLDTLFYLSRKTGKLGTEMSRVGSSVIFLHGTHGTDWSGSPVLFQIPVIRSRADQIEDVEIGYLRVEANSERGAQRAATFQLREHSQWWIDVYNRRDARRERGMKFEDNRWRKMTALEQRFFAATVEIV